MSIVLSKEQLVYVQSFGKVILNACPGSGKTTTVAYKLDELIKNWELLFSKNSGILCLSFTNVAKNEIAEKFKEKNGFSLPYPHYILTIDSFVNSFITLPFAHKLKDIGKRYKIIDDISYLDKIFQSDWQLMKTYKSYLFSYKPSKIDYTINSGYSWDGHDKSDDLDFVKYAKEIKTRQINMGLLKTSDSAFLAYLILKKYPRIAKYIASKFPYLIIDEAQDTSEIQHSILELLYNQGLKNIDLVGDPYQCLYQWRDASPELFLQKFDDCENWKGLYLTENRRSTKKIIEVFSMLRRTTDKEIIPILDSEADLPLHVIKYDKTDYSEAISKYEKLCLDNNLSSNIILVRGNALKNSLLGKESDYFPWDKSSIAYKLIQSRIHLQSNEIKEAVKKIRRLIIELLIPGISFSDLKEKENELKNDKDSNSIIFKIVRDIPSFDLSLKEWTVKTQQYLKSELQLENMPDFKIRKKNVTKKGKITFDKTTLENSVNHYFKKAITENNFPITTIHQVKGMTFDSVFMILNDKNHKENITLNDFVLKEEMPTEKQRLIYVAISRPRNLLCIGVPKTMTDEKLKEFLNCEMLIL
ncbi:superfamily I DNA/RNA helicase [Flavobacterium cauense R2A-7]|uniref:DNA 3'-5' helicase n=1 Tax=Flavobacterium cauense R2A-7 TaxID=1341154 RepID=A0A562M5Z0_9FLAO|nr:ATP-dependent helicase [Flavobacterium cauense]TWI15336.1 superfamily I DNA/RNA helicase [Flavobacterium cauense R2A-7]